MLFLQNETIGVRLQVHFSNYGCQTSSEFGEMVDIHTRGGDPPHFGKEAAFMWSMWHKLMATDEWWDCILQVFILRFSL